ncbi:hypothetical protein V6N13_105873 [Hibiscus sabdariffa]
MDCAARRPGYYFLQWQFLGRVGSSSATSRKLLAKSVDNLLAVEMLFPWPSNPAKVGFKVLRLNREEQKWMEMESLKDRILGFHRAISAPAFEFCSGKGNSSSIQEPASPLENWPAYCNLFCLLLPVPNLDSLDMFSYHFRVISSYCTLRSLKLS